MAWFVRQIGEVTGVPLQSTPETAGTFVGTDGDAVGAAGDIGVGFVIDESAATNPDQMVDAYGDGSILENDAASFTPELGLYSDGDGTISHTKGPVAVGRALTSTKFKVNITTTEEA